MNRPFDGVAVVVTRPALQSAPLMEKIRSMGGTPVSMPLIDVQFREDDAVLSAVHRLCDYNALIFTSANAVRAFVRACRQAGVDVLSAAPVCYAVGRSTAREAEQADLRCFTSAQVKTSEDLANWLLTLDAFRQPARTLFLHGQLSDTVPAHVLTAAGHSVDAVVCYDTVHIVHARECWQPLFEGGGRTVILLYSPSAVASLMRQCADWLCTGDNNVALAAIGSTTAAAVRSAGCEPQWTARKPLDDSLLAVVAEDLGRDNWPVYRKP